MQTSPKAAGMGGWVPVSTGTTDGGKPLPDYLNRTE